MAGSNGARVRSNFSHDGSSYWSLKFSRSQPESFAGKNTGASFPMKDAHAGPSAVAFVGAALAVHMLTPAGISAAATVGSTSRFDAIFASGARAVAGVGEPTNRRIAVLSGLSAIAAPGRAGFVPPIPIYRIVLSDDPVYRVVLSDALGTDD